MRRFLLSMCAAASFFTMSACPSAVDQKATPQPSPPGVPTTTATSTSGAVSTSTSSDTSGVCDSTGVL